MEQRNPQILIVEDEPHMGAGGCAQFEYGGLPSATAVRRREGLERALKRFPDWIIFAVMLPRMAGLMSASNKSKRRLSRSSAHAEAKNGKVVVVGRTRAGAETTRYHAFFHRETTRAR